MRLILWQNIPSLHQSPYIRKIAERQNIEVVLVVQESLPAWRRNIGWSDPDFGRAQVIAQPELELISRLCASTTSNDVHLFSGIRAYPMVWTAFQQASRTPARIGLLSEASNWLGWSGRLRHWRARLDAAQLGARVDFVLAIGQLGVQWFTINGYEPSKIFPFIYVTELTDIRPSQQLSGSNTDVDVFRLIFIGQCVRRKGVDLLIDAVAELKHLRWELTIVGDGVDRPDLEKQTAALGLQDRVQFLGSKANHEALELLGISDLLVLPSRWDGWGAVINEALMLGVPAICSDLCGASDLIQDNERGEVFPVGSVDALRAVLAKRMSAGKRTEETAHRIKSWTQAISGDSAANYLLDVIGATAGKMSRPTPPWLIKDCPSADAVAE